MTQGLTLYARMIRGDSEAGSRLVSWQLGSLIGWALTRRRVRGATQELATLLSLLPQQI